jgi:group I intron endonuclease
LDILEYCKSNVLILREQHYIDIINPEYNILRVAGNILGFKHSEATKVQLSIINTGVSNPLFGKKHTSETRRKISESLRLNITPKIITTETRLKISSRSHGVSVKIFDKSNNFINEFPTITSAAKHFNVDPKTLSMIFKTGKSYDNYIYKFKVKDLRIRVYDSSHNLVIILDSIKKTSL